MFWDRNAFLEWDRCSRPMRTPEEITHFEGHYYRTDSSHCSYVYYWWDQQLWRLAIWELKRRALQLSRRLLSSIPVSSPAYVFSMRKVPDRILTILFQNCLLLIGSYKHNRPLQVAVQRPRRPIPHTFIHSSVPTCKWRISSWWCSASHILGTSFTTLLKTET
jgi:hypothetical protein